MSTTNLGFEVNQDTQRTSEEIDNNGFFPALSLAEFVTLFAIPSTIENDLLKAKLLVAMDEVNQKLNSFKEQQIKNGFATLASVPGDQLGGESAKLMQYKQAVYAEAKAELINTSVSMARRAEAENSAASAAELLSYYKKISTNAVARITGRGSIGVHLI